MCYIFFTHIVFNSRRSISSCEDPIIIRYNFNILNGSDYTGGGSSLHSCVSLGEAVSLLSHCEKRVFSCSSPGAEG